MLVFLDTSTLTSFSNSDNFNACSTIPQLSGNNSSLSPISYWNNIIEWACCSLINLLNVFAMLLSHLNYIYLSISPTSSVVIISTLAVLVSFVDTFFIIKSMLSSKETSSSWYWKSTNVLRTACNIRFWNATRWLYGITLGLQEGSSINNSNSSLLKSNDNGVVCQIWTLKQYFPENVLTQINRFWVYILVLYNMSRWI